MEVIKIVRKTTKGFLKMYKTEKLCTSDERQLAIQYDATIFMLPSSVG